MESIMNLTDYKISALIYPCGEHWLEKAADVIDEGAFYRIDGTNIFDKYKIQNIVLEDGCLTIKMKDQTVYLVIKKTDY